MIATPPDVHAKHLELRFRSASCEACNPPAAPSRRARHRLSSAPVGAGPVRRFPPANVGSRPLQAAATATTTGHRAG